MNSPHQSNPIPLPESIAQRFVRLRRRLFVVDTLRAVSLSIGGLLASFLALFVADRFFAAPIWLRLALFSLGGLTFFGAWFLWIRAWTWRWPNQKTLAVLVQRKFKNIGDRLLSIVELTEEKSHPANYSERLYRAAIQQVAEEVKPCDFEASVNTRPLKRLAGWAAAAVLACAAAWLVFPGAARNAWSRWTHPLASIPRYTLVEIDELASHRIVAHGEPFEIELKARYHSFWKPGKIKAQVPGRADLEFRLEEGKATLELPGITSESRISFRVGDDYAEMTILPVHRPSLRSLTAKIRLPEYLRHEDGEASVEGGSLELLEGSSIQLSGVTDRELNSAAYLQNNEPLGDLPLDGSAFQSPFFDPAGLFEIQLTWEDKHGLTNSVPWPLSLDWKQDQSPAPRFEHSGMQIMLLETEVLELKTLVEDDYGVIEHGLRWHVVENTVGESAETQRQVVTEKPKGFSTTNVEHSFFFSPSVYQLPANTVVELRVYAKDAYPGRRMVVSDPLQVLVIGNEDHFEFVRSELESILARLEEVSRMEDELLSETGKIRDMDLENAESTPEGLPERLNELAESQDMNAESLERLAMEGARALREAMRNPMFDDQSLQDWAKNIRAMQELSNQQMSQASQSLRSAAQSQSPQEQGENVESAEQTQQEILDQLAQLQSQVNDELDHLEALTLAQRLRKKGREEGDISQSLQDVINSTIGLKPAELSEHLSRKNKLIAAEQLEKTQETEALMGEISRYFERTEEEPYGRVVDEMEARQTTQALRKLSEDIEQNIAMFSIQNLADWTRQFQEWADILDPESAAAGGGGEGGASSGENPNKDIEHMMALLRLREQEVGLRRKSQLLAQQWEQVRNATESAKDLGGVQSDIKTKVRDIQFETLNDIMESVLNQAYKSMNAAEQDLSAASVTDQAIESQSESIIRLSDAINLVNEKIKQSQSSSSQQASSSAAQDMAFLLQMMSMAQTPGMQPGQSQGGGNLSGGEARNPTSPLAGNADGQLGGERKIETGSGAVQQAPMEFRQALERYFKAVEKAGY